MLTAGAYGMVMASNYNARPRPAEVCVSPDGKTWAVARAFHIEMPFVGSWLMLALLVVGVAVPTPGAVGGYHEAFRLGATAFFGADNDAAVGAAILLHATSYVPVTVLGLWFALRDGLNLQGIKQMTETAEPVEVKA